MGRLAGFVALVAACASLAPGAQPTPAALVFLLRSGDGWAGYEVAYTVRVTPVAPLGRVRDTLWVAYHVTVDGLDGDTAVATLPMVGDSVALLRTLRARATPSARELIRRAEFRARCVERDPGPPDPRRWPCVN